jgi:ribosomal protein S12 methylthiotransferase
MKKFNIVSLGCAKTRVDSEYIVALLEERGYIYTEKSEEAQYLIVNTCSFIEPAREESLDTIIELGNGKTKEQKLIVVGCLPQRYGTDLIESLPEVDSFIGTSTLNEIVEVVDGSKKNSLYPGMDSWIPNRAILRKSSISKPMAYLKIAEGCNRSCAFCAVPGIRGKQKSLSPVQLIDEAKMLAENGVKEINLIAQDLTAWGVDLNDKPNLTLLVEKLSEIKGISWIRLLYLYPSMVSDSLLDLMAHEPKVVPYVDIPIQHMSDKVLSSMRRGYKEKDIWQLIEKFRKAVPGIYLRTTILTGHPGENEKEYDLLRDGIKKLKFDHLGVFNFSPEEGTKAFDMEAPPLETGIARKDEILDIQKEISRKKQKEMIGKIVPVLVEEYDLESMIYMGRHHGQAPEVDGITYLSKGEFKVGEMVDLKISDSSEYDLSGIPV